VIIAVTASKGFSTGVVDLDPADQSVDMVLQIVLAVLPNRLQGRL